MRIEETLAQSVAQALKSLYQIEVESQQIKIEITNTDFEGDFTVLVFPFVRHSKQSPEQTGDAIGANLTANNDWIEVHNVVKGFLNLSLTDSFWLEWLKEVDLKKIGKAEKKPSEKVIVEYSSPNTNKPLHLGHIRNNLLGFSVCELLSFYGYDVKKVNLVNDRGIHICKSMLAYQKWGNSETPESSGLKGDHLIGKYYVAFDKAYKVELKEIIQNEINSKVSNTIESGTWTMPNANEPVLACQHKFYQKALINYIEECFKLEKSYNREKISVLSDSGLSSSDLDISISKKRTLFLSLISRNKFLSSDIYDPENSDQLIIKKHLDIAIAGVLKELEDEKTIIDKVPLLKEARNMLLSWEQGDDETIALWHQLNNWVYDGFQKTYSTLGVSFDKYYYESNTYLLGKDNVQEGLDKNVFYKKEDGSVWIDLEKEKLDHKILQRGDGTSLYITQDMGTADLKYDDFKCDKSIIVVGNEQDYHFKVLFKILEKLERPYAAGNYHLSYGMVDLPSGKMKSREGTVVDADDLMAEMIAAAKEKTEALGKTDEMSDKETEQLHYDIGMAALKYFILKVDPVKRMLFDPQESIDLQGDTGPFIQYSYTRIQSILRQAEKAKVRTDSNLEASERKMILLLSQFTNTIEKAVNNYSPAVVANYIYELARSFNKLYADVSILKEEDEAKRENRVNICKATAHVLKEGLSILGINAPERM